MINKRWILLLGILFILYGLAMLGLYSLQEQLIFPGKKLDDNFRFHYDTPFKEVSIPVAGAELHALHFQQKQPRGLIFFLHGNAGNLQTWATDIDFYVRENYDLFIMDYRGYGKSTGKIQSQEQLHHDVLTAWNAIHTDYPNQPIVIYGRSLGSALAVELARQVEHELLVLVSPFTSMNAMAKKLYPLAPLGLLRYPLATDQQIAKVSSPILFIHGNRDDFIPMGHSQRLQALSTSPSELLIIDGAGHNDIHQYPAYVDGLARALP